ncbi:HAMP domain-containing sensor histidine kinase [Gracilibacillus dipsosauri]|uniref:histidine kinase n=1 Tax=Gracilibacillus dipsosauri TaxID=178340 RepID=A0A317KVZ4_9BACI|nr:HAMP domain-containing sensor histidine kinase [Gracilibacillus dipsosauri]PWU67657.1 two-component sensor histidine kinase [Gracilibacillus dipsosauri]
MFRKKRNWLPKKFILRLTILNTIVVTIFVLLTGWGIYNTACFLVEGMVNEVDRQEQFRASLLEYLLLFSLFTVVCGSLLHFYFMNKLIEPLKKLIQSTQRMKEGFYPEPIQNHASDEMGEFIDHFNQLVVQLKIKEQQCQRIVSDLSHEFRTPLSNLNGYLNALKSGLIEGDSKLYESLLKESKRLIKLVEQMDQLKEWDVDSEQPLSEKESTNIVILIEQSIEMFRWLLNKEGLRCEMQAEYQKLHLNIGGISQVISNLIDNAIRYHKGNSLVTIKGESLDQVYRVSITSEGQTIPQGEQAKIFERFHRIENSRSRELGGSGLGLAISKEIVERHKGSIGLISNGNRHTFWFTLPIEAQ